MILLIKEYFFEVVQRIASIRVAHPRRTMTGKMVSAGGQGIDFSSSSATLDRRAKGGNSLHSHKNTSVRRSESARVPGVTRDSSGGTKNRNVGIPTRKVGRREKNDFVTSFRACFFMVIPVWVWKYSEIIVRCYIIVACLTAAPHHSFWIQCQLAIMMTAFCFPTTPFTA